MNAVAVIDAPSAGNVAAFLAQHGTNNREQFQRTLDRAALVREIRTPEQRIAFFRSFAEATGGVSEDVAEFIAPLAGRVSFAHLAHLADSVPEIVPPADSKQSAGNLRQEIARLSRDATANERWSWLSKRAEDRPTGKVLDRLVAEWCHADYRETAA
jgi:hypothetical protein